MGKHWFGPYLLFCAISPSCHSVTHFAMNLDTTETTKTTSEKEGFSTSKKIRPSARPERVPGFS